MVVGVLLDFRVVIVDLIVNRHTFRANRFIGFPSSAILERPQIVKEFSRWQRQILTTLSFHPVIAIWNVTFRNVVMKFAALLIKYKNYSSKTLRPTATWRSKIPFPGCSGGPD